MSLNSIWIPSDTWAKGLPRVKDKHGNVLDDDLPNYSSVPKRPNGSIPNLGVVHFPETGIKIHVRSGEGNPGTSVLISPGLEKLSTGAASHVEMHVAGIMRQSGLQSATLKFNVNFICKSCKKNLAKALPNGARLNIEFINKNGLLEKWLCEGGKGWTLL